MKMIGKAHFSKYCGHYYSILVKFARLGAQVLGFTCFNLFKQHHYFTIIITCKCHSFTKNVLIVIKSRETTILSVSFFYDSMLLPEKLSKRIKLLLTFLSDNYFNLKLGI